MSQQMDWTAYGGSAAEIYERHMVPAIFGPWAEDLLALATPQPGERVLDVACGTGVVARLVAPRVSPSGTVVGLDLNPGMLAVARTLPPQHGGQIEWCLRASTSRLAAFGAELRGDRQPGPTVAALARQGRPALLAELRAWPILTLALRALHT